MSNRLTTLLERMPSHFAKDENSNNYKLLKIVAENSVENRAVYETILKFWDVDQSQGIGLDRLGKNVGIGRGSWNDTDYRKMIKIQSILNLSEGDIPTMNLIMDAYMGDAFIGFQDGWKFFDPATLIAYIKDASKPLPGNILKKIKSAGVGTHWMLNQIMGHIHVQVKSHTFEVPYPITNMFTTAEMHGVMTKIAASLDVHSIDSNVNYRVANMFTTEDYTTRTQISAGATLQVDDYYVPYIRLGENDLGDGLRLGGYVSEEESSLSRVIMRTSTSIANVSDNKESLSMSTKTEDSTVTYKRVNDITLGEVDL